MKALLMGCQIQLGDGKLNPFTNVVEDDIVTNIVQSDGENIELGESGI